MPTRLNIGCGRSPTPDWINYDNSPSVWIARWPRLALLLSRLGLIDRHALGFVETGRTAHQGYDRPTSVTMRKRLA